jgi:hypothetical protein
MRIPGLHEVEISHGFKFCIIPRDFQTKTETAHGERAVLYCIYMLLMLTALLVLCLGAGGSDKELHHQSRASPGA